MAHWAVIGVLLAWAALPHRTAKPPTERPRAMPNFCRVFGNRDVLVLTVGYAATIWGTAGLRQWIVVFLAFCVANQGNSATQDWSMLMIGALIGLLGVPAGLFGNELSLRLGLRATAMGVFLVSVLVNALFGFAVMLPYGAVVALAMVAGFVVQGNFSNLTSGLLAVAEPRRRGSDGGSVPRASALLVGSSARCCLGCLSIGLAERRSSRRGWRHSVSARSHA